MIQTGQSVVAGLS